MKVEIDYLLYIYIVHTRQGEFMETLGYSQQNERD